MDTETDLGHNIMPPLTLHMMRNLSITGVMTNYSPVCFDKEIGVFPPLTDNIYFFLGQDRRRYRSLDNVFTLIKLRREQSVWSTSREIFVRKKFYI